jgi:hypothetical protein
MWVGDIVQDEFVNEVEDDEIELLQTLSSH